MSQMQFLFSDELIVDNFAGGGGASEGIEQAFGRPVDIAINHDKQAIRMHEINHPHTKHYRESVWDVDPVKVTKGRPVALAWFSPDCTHFSKAKGGTPVKKKIRGLAWVVLRWAALVKPRIICLENVEEFQTWGPITRKRGRDAHPKPCKYRKSKTFGRWISQLESLGYKVEKKELSACDYGAPTTRKRLFIIARRDGEPIVWPEPTHGPSLANPYRTAAECIDWSRPCPSIFLTKEEAAELRKQTGIKVKRPLVDATMRRIAKGVRRYVIEAAEPFIVPVDGSPVSPTMIAIDNRSANGSLANSINEPTRTIVTENRLALVSAFLAQHNTGVVGHAADDPMSTITSRGTQQNLVAASVVRQFGQSVGSHPGDPIGAVTAGGGGKTGLVASHMVKLRGKADNRNSAQGVDQPVPTITANGTHLAEVRAFLMKYYGTDQDPRIDEPLHTATTKHRFGLVTVHGEVHQIVDIGMRMFIPRELYRAQGFPDHYVIDPVMPYVKGDKVYTGKPLPGTAQVRMCGNSVSPYVARAIVEANAGVKQSQVAA